LVDADAHAVGEDDIADADLAGREAELGDGHAVRLSFAILTDSALYSSWVSRSRASARVRRSRTVTRAWWALFWIAPDSSVSPGWQVESNSSWALAAARSTRARSSAAS